MLSNAVCLTALAAISPDAKRSWLWLFGVSDVTELKLKAFAPWKFASCELSLDSLSVCLTALLYAFEACCILTPVSPHVFWVDVWAFLEACSTLAY